MHGEAYNNASFEAGGDGKSTSGPPIPMELESGCAEYDIFNDNPGGGSMISGCAGWDTPDGSLGGCSVVSGCAGSEMLSDNPGGGSMTRASVVTTGLGPGFGPTIGP